MDDKNYPLVRMKNIDKIFYGSYANRNVDFELFSVLIKTAKSYHVVTIQYDLYDESFYISHPSYNFSFEDIEMYAILAKD